MPIRPENKKRYPKDWKLRSRFVRFIRGKGKCENCGAEQGTKAFKSAEFVMSDLALLFLGGIFGLVFGVLGTIKGFATWNKRKS